MRGFNLPIEKPELLKRLGYKYLDDVRRRGNQFVPSENLRRQARQLANLLVDEHNRYGILMNGYVGAGKSTMARAIKGVVNDMVNENVFKHNEIMDFHYMAMINARDMVKAYIRSYNSDGEEFRLMKSRKWLIIDDLGTDQKDVSLYGTVFNPFLELLDYRYEYLRPTIIVTNLTASELSRKYDDPRLTDRMREMFSIVTFDDKSFRV